MFNLSTVRAGAFPLSSVRLHDGPFQRQQDVHLEFLRDIEPDRMLAPYLIQAALPPEAPRYGGWESRDIGGHSLGHYLSALCLMQASTGDEELLRRIDYIIGELERCQQANGDGYVLPVEKKAFQDVRDGRIDASPFSLNGVWVPNYTLHKLLAGLRDSYQLAGSGKALEIARKLADWLDGILGGLDETRVQQMLRTEHGGMNEVLADLAADTGDARYLEMAAKYFHHQAVLAPMLRGEDRLNGLHGNTQIPKVVGLAREFELCSDPSYHLAATSFWDHVVNHRSYAIGGHGESEHFFPLEQFPASLTPNTCETCNTYNMLKLTKHLFSWEPRAERMDFVERAMINHLLANIGRQPGEFGYFLGLGSVGVKAFSTPFDSWWCCVGTGMENPARYGEQIYFHNGDTLWVNLFMGSTATWRNKGVTLRQDTMFPDGDHVRLTLSCRQPERFTLKIRHPYWCETPVLKINGRLVSTNSSPASYISVDRLWDDGDTIELHLLMRLRLEPLPHSEGKTVALMYGPMVLAAIVPDEPGIPNPAKLRFGDHLSSRGKTDAFPPLFVAENADEVLSGLKPAGSAFAEFRGEGVMVPEDLVFMPFHRIYEEQYAVYLSLMNREEWALREQEIRATRERQRLHEAATIDSVTPGFQQPEVEHGLRVETSEVGDFQDRKWRDARNGGWFSYDMAVEPAGPVVIIATYWGGEWKVRNFDILIDHEVIATQRLRTNRPGDFYEEIYPVPLSLTAGKSKVNVRFQAHPGDTAGGLFGLRVMSAAREETVFGTPAGE